MLTGIFVCCVELELHFTFEDIVDVFVPGDLQHDEDDLVSKPVVYQLGQVHVGLLGGDGADLLDDLGLLLGGPRPDAGHDDGVADRVHGQRGYLALERLDQLVLHSTRSRQHTPAGR